MSERSRRDAYEDGRTAFRRAESLEENWYGRPSDEHREWQRGWLDAQRERARQQCGCALCELGGPADKYCEVSKAWPVFPPPHPVREA